jgi:preflagellin peptidase FlaK
VEIEEIFGLTAFVITMIILIYASVRDWKERQVPDEPWIILSIIGLIMFVSYSIYLTGFRWEYILLAAGTAMIIIDIFFDREFNVFIFYFIMAILFIVPLYGNMSEDIFIAWASIPLCYIIFILLYIVRIVRGGADVKCLIALSIMFPLYPFFFGLPLIDVPDNIVSQIFIFSIAVLFIAAVLTIPMILYFAIRSSRDTGFSKRMFTGYRMDISAAEKADVWPTEDIINGNLEHIKIPNEEEIGAIYARLREAGQEKVWVTPMIPFIIFITVAAAILFLIGNPLFLIF